MMREIVNIIERSSMRFLRLDGPGKYPAKIGTKNYAQHLCGANLRPSNGKVRLRQKE